MLTQKHAAYLRHLLDDALQHGAEAIHLLSDNISDLDNYDAVLYSIQGRQLATHHSGKIAHHLLPYLKRFPYCGGPKTNLHLDEIGVSQGQITILEQAFSNDYANITIALPTSAHERLILLDHLGKHHVSKQNQKSSSSGKKSL